MALDEFERQEAAISAGGKPSSAFMDVISHCRTAPSAPAARVETYKGKAVYESSCIQCHGAGVMGAPKTGDKTAWGPLLKGGMNALYASSIKGKGAMPPKGGNVTLADADVNAAVDYMVSLVK
jgi:cytochrome c5